MRLQLLTALSLLAFAGPAPGVIIDSGTGTGNTSPPVPDPGWSNVGTIVASGLTGVYLGGKFVLTAYHVGAGDVTLGGVAYQYVPGTAVQLDNGNGTFADLLMFEIHPEPPLPALEIASLAPLGNVILVGNGRDRGTATTWDPPGSEGPFEGWEWALTASKRWGTNTVEGLPFEIFYEPLNTYTMAFTTDFDGPGLTQTEHEAQAAVGDSGGATFAVAGTQWQLAGTMFLTGIYAFPDGQGGYYFQPDSTALYGNETYSADLSFYRDRILEVMELPEPSGSLGPGALAAALLARRWRNRAAQ